MRLSGGLQKTVMKSQSDCSIGITAAAAMPMGENQNYSAVPERKSSLEHGKGMLFGFGDDFETIADKQESTVPCSEMKADTVQASLSDRLTQSLISAGLVCGIIPLSMRDGSGQQTLDAVLKPRAGGDAGPLKAVC